MMMICLESSSKRKYIFDILFEFSEKAKLSKFQTFLSREHSRFANIFNAESISILLYMKAFFWLKTFASYCYFYPCYVIFLIWTKMPKKSLRLKTESLFIIPIKPSLFLKIRRNISGICCYVICVCCSYAAFRPNVSKES